MKEKEDKFLCLLQKQLIKKWEESRNLEGNLIWMYLTLVLNNSKINLESQLIKILLN
jgi:hypothetical protein